MIEAFSAISNQRLEDVERLAESLVNKARLNLYKGLYSMDSLIQRNAYNKLKEEDRIKYHQRAVDYYLSIPIPKRENRRGKKDILPLLEAYYHACKAENYEQAYQLMFDNGLNLDLMLWGESTTLLELCKEIPEKPCPLPKECQ